MYRTIQCLNVIILFTDRSSSPQQVDGLSIERLTLLGRVHVARVVVDQLLLADNVRTPTKSKSASKGKPPRPASAKR